MRKICCWSTHPSILLVTMAILYYQQVTVLTKPDDFINICVMISDVQAGEVAYRRFAAIIDIAIRHANDLLLPPNVTLRKYYLPEKPRKSGPCLSGCTATRALDLIHTGSNCHMFLGPDTPSSLNSIYGVAYAYDIPILSTAEYGISHRDESPLLTLPFLHVAKIIQVMIRFLQYRGYSYVALFQDQSDKLFAAYGDEFYDAYARSFNIANSESIHLTPAQFRQNETSDEEMKAYLSYAKTRSRVFVIFTFFTTFKHILLLADDLGMTTNEYQYLTVHPYEDLFYGTTDLNSVKAVEQATILRILRGNVAIVSLKLTRPLGFSDFEDIVRQQAMSNYAYYFPPTQRIDALVTAHYDSVILFATAVQKLQKAGLNYQDGSLLSMFMRNTSYQGLQSGMIRIDSNGDARMSYDILGVVTESTEFTPIWEFDPMTDQFRALRELTGPTPLDVPLCGFTGDAPICRDHQRMSMTVIVLSAVLPLTVIVALATLIFYRTVSRLKTQLNPNWWKIRPEDLRHTYKRTRIFNGSNSASNSDIIPTYPRSLACGPEYTTGTYGGNDVLIQNVSILRVQLSPLILKQLNLLRSVSHENLQKFFGIHLDQNGIFISIVTELCSKGDLTTLLENRTMKLDWTIKSSFIRDLVQGMAYLHTTNIQSHGNLNSHCCMIDGKFTLKVACYGQSYLRTPEDLAPVTSSETTRNYEELLWRAPEFLSIAMSPNGTPKGDVYSFGIILQQIVLESRPFAAAGDAREKYSARDIVHEVKQSNVPPTRPYVSRSACPNAVLELMEYCWSEVPLERPSFAKIRDQLKRILGKFQDNIVEQLLDRMDQYARDLESQVAEKTMQFLDEKRKSDDLLNLILPASVAAALIHGEVVEPESYNCVTIYFSDIVGFTTIASELAPLQVIFFLNSLYTSFDQVLELYNVYKVETIGDAYMVVSGLPIRNGERHSAEMSDAALHLREEILRFDVSTMTNRPVQLRSGLNSGPCVAGVVGLKMPRYCLFGDTVNVASRMESSGEAMKIQITQATKALLDIHGGFSIVERGSVEIKGKGIVTTYWLLGRESTD